MFQIGASNQGSGGPIEPDDHQKLRFQVVLNTSNVEDAGPKGNWS